METKMKIYTLDPIKKPLQRHFRKHPKASIYSAFKKYRKVEKYKMFGDYPLISLITFTVAELGIKPSEISVKKALRISKDLKGRSTVSKQLLEGAMQTYFEAKKPS